jgi:hypothetical protein
MPSRFVFFGQLLTTLTSPAEAAHLALYADADLAAIAPDIPSSTRRGQLLLFSTI